MDSNPNGPRKFISDKMSEFGSSMGEFLDFIPSLFTKIVHYFDIRRNKEPEIVHITEAQFQAKSEQSGSQPEITHVTKEDAEEIWKNTKTSMNEIINGKKEENSVDNQ